MTGDTQAVKPNAVAKQVKQHYQLYVMLIPALAVLLLFKYTPMYGLAIAFQDYNVFKGISGSEWVGLENFSKLIHSEDFFRVFANTLIISILKLVFTFPFPILVAVLLNEIRTKWFKSVLQTSMYLPHFLSWVVIASLFTIMLSADGPVNAFLGLFGLDPISFMMDNRFFRGVVVFSSGWKESGWNSIIYVAAIAGIDQDMYEAADIDGAGRIQKMAYITLPSIMPTIIMLLVLRLGNLLNVGVEQILAMYNPLVYETGDVIGTYVYREGLGHMNYSFGTAVGLFNSVIGFILVMSGNWISRKFIQMSIW